MAKPHPWARRLDGIALAAGGLVAWLVIAMTVTQVALVLGRAMFGFGSLQLSEAVIYANAVFVGVGVAYALSRDGHTRIDVLRVKMNDIGRARVDFWACLVLLLPTIIVLIWASLPYVIRAWQTLEGSRSVGGMQGVFLFKSMLIVMPALLVLPGLAMFLRSYAGLSKPPFEAVQRRSATDEQ